MCNFSGSQSFWNCTGFRPAKGSDTSEDSCCSHEYPDRTERARPATNRLKQQTLTLLLVVHSSPISNLVTILK